MFERQEYEIDVSKKGTIRVMAHSMDEAKEMAADMDEKTIEQMADWDEPEIEGVY